MTHEFLSTFPQILSASSEWIESLKLFSIKIIDINDFFELLLRFLLNTAMLTLIVRFPYLKHSSHRNYTFSYIAVGGIVFLLCFLLNSVKLELGFALGLFAIFGIIRYRTDAIPFKQMTYLFVVIGVSVINALANKKVSYAELIFTNLAILGGLWLLERFLDRHHEGTMRIEYEDITKINTANYAELLADLSTRTGYDIHRFTIEKIDYMRDSATITIFFNQDDNTYLTPEKSDANDEKY